MGVSGVSALPSWKSAEMRPSLLFEACMVPLCGSHLFQGGPEQHLGIPENGGKMSFSSYILRFALSAINLWGRSGRGHCRKFSANFREISANFPQNFRTLSWRNKTHFFANFREFSAEFPQTFRKNPFANDPISWQARAPKE